MELINAEEFFKTFPELAIEPYINAPTVDVYTKDDMTNAYLKGYADCKDIAERSQGEWIFNQYDGTADIGNWHCSECRHIVYGGYSQKPYYNFCPNCGAKMKGGAE